MLTEFEFNKIIEALGHAERNAHPLNREMWQRVAERAKEELPLLMASTREHPSASCRCEDKPACGCDADVYQPADSVYDRNDPNNYDPEEHFAGMEQQELQREACSICSTYFDDDDNEDDEVQGFHAECAESQA
jgi:hypothetical protein